MVQNHMNDGSAAGRTGGVSKPPNYRAAQRALQSGSYRIRSAMVENLRGHAGARIVRLLLPLIDDPHYEVRYLTAEAFGYLRRTRTIVTALIQVLADRDEVVRLNAALSLGRIRARTALPHLIGALCFDEDALVRGYAAEAIGDIGEKSLAPILELALRKEHSIAARLRIQKALYVLGETRLLSRFLDNLDTADYRQRSACANLLPELVNISNATRIAARLKRRLSKESTAAVRSSIEATLATIQRRFRHARDPRRATTRKP